MKAKKKVEMKSSGKMRKKRSKEIHSTKVKTTKKSRKSSTGKSGKMMKTKAGNRERPTFDIAMMFLIRRMRLADYSYLEIFTEFEKVHTKMMFKEQTGHSI